MHDEIVNNTSTSENMNISFISMYQCYLTPDETEGAFLKKAVALYINPLALLYASFGYFILMKQQAIINRRTRDQQQRFRRHLQWLCVWDIGSLMITMIIFMVPYSVYGKRVGRGPLIYVLTIYLFMCSTNVSIMCEQWHLVLIFVERLLVVRRPLHSKHGRGRLPNIHLSSIILLIVCSLFASFKFMLSFTIERCCINSRVCMWQVGLRSWDEMTERTLEIISRLIQLMLKSPLPFIIICGATIGIGLIIRKMNNRQGEPDFSSSKSLMSNDIIRSKNYTIQAIQRHNVRLSCMLVILNIKYLILLSPTVIEEFLLEYLHSTAQDYFIEISNLFVILHCCTNWMVFYNWRSNRKQHNLRTPSCKMVNNSCKRSITQVNTSDDIPIRLTKREIASSIQTWEKVEKSEFCHKLLECTLNKPQLTDLSTSELVTLQCSVASIITFFNTQMFGVLPLMNGDIEAGQYLSALGAKHSALGVIFSNETFDKIANTFEREWFETSKACAFSNADVSLDLKRLRARRLALFITSRMQQGYYNAAEIIKS